MVISKWKKNFGVHGSYKNISALRQKAKDVRALCDVVVSAAACHTEVWVLAPSLRNPVVRGAFWYVIFQISRDLIPAAYENEKNSLTFLVWLPL